MSVQNDFVDNKYRRWYFQICDRARRRTLTGGIERHHVVPLALGGAEDECVDLTYREHFLAHWLLTKFTSGVARKKMNFALWCMSRNNKGRRIIASWQYAVAKKARLAAGGWKHNPETLARMSFYQRNRSPETLAKISASLKGHTHNVGSKRTAEARARMSAAMMRWHARLRAEQRPGDPYHRVPA